MKYLLPLFVVATASAAEPTPHAPLALIAQVGWYHGLAAGADLRLGNGGLRATAGGNLIILTIVDAETYELSSVEAFGTGQINGDAYLLFPLDGGAELGFSFGGKYNTLLGVGVGGAFEVRKQLSPRFGFGVSVGLVYFPDGEERLVENEGYPPGVEFNVPFGAAFQGGGGVSIHYELL